MRRRPDQRGFMTLELALASTMALIVVLGIATVGGSVLKYFREGSDRVRLQQEVGRSMSVMQIDVRKAGSFTIYDPSDPGTALLAGPAVRLLDAGGAPIDGFKASPDGTRLVDDAGHPLSAEGLTLSDLWFTALADSTLGITLSLQDRHGNDVSTSSGVGPRN